MPTTSSRSIALRSDDLRAALESTAQVTHERARGRVLPADAEIVVDDVGRHADDLEHLDRAGLERLEQLVQLHAAGRHAPRSLAGRARRQTHLSQRLGGSERAKARPRSTKTSSS